MVAVHRVRIVFLWLMVGSGCSSSEDAGDVQPDASVAASAECGPEMDPIFAELTAEPTESPPNTRAALTVTKTSGTVSGTSASSYRPFFFDVTNFESTPVPSEQSGPSCRRITGNAVSSGDPIPLTVLNLRIEGLGDDAIVIDEFTGTRTVALDEGTLGDAPIVFAAERSEISERSFPNFRLEGKSPARFESFTARRLSEDGLEISWERGDASYVRLLLITKDLDEPDNASLWNRVECLVRDDGCHRVPESALIFLALNQPEASFEIERHEVTSMVLESGDELASIDAIQKVSAEIDLLAGFSGDVSP